MTGRPGTPTPSVSGSSASATSVPGTSVSGVSGTSTAGGAPGRPRDYRLLVPATWFRIDLDPRHRDRAVRALVDRQLRGADDLPHVRRALVDEFARRCEEAFAVGGVEMYVATDRIGPLPLAASLVVSVISAPDHVGGALGPDDWCGYLRERGMDAAVVTIPAGRAVRTRRRNGLVAGDESGATATTTNVDVRVPVPRTQGYLLLSFSTPLDSIADAVVDLFDAITGSLRWVE